MMGLDILRELFISLLLTQVIGSLSPEVQLKQGILQGKYDETFNGRQFMAFLGVPYAKPPTGKHRFKEAVASTPWIGTYQAIKTPSDCLQFDHSHYKTEFAIHGSEDCLYINVFTPKLPSKQVEDKLMDVIVYIHGGAFMFSAGHYYGPRFLLDEDIVFVSLNYRLGALGFLSTEDSLIPGNNGLKDQVLALKWVQDNIAAFGGNPKSVTIAGMSAGAASVHFHILSPLSKGLFKQGISLSGSALCPWTQAENSREKTYSIANELGCPVNVTTKMLDCLRQRPARDIVQATGSLMPWLYNPFSPLGPVVEKPGPKAFIDKQPIDIMKEGLHNDVPWLVSFTSHEGLYPGAEIICNDTNIDNLISDWNNIAHHLLDYAHTVDSTRLNDVNSQIWAKYLADSTSNQKEALIHMLSDRLFLVDIIQAAKLHAISSTSPVYVHQFSYRGKNSLSDLFCPVKDDYGVSHADDLGYVLNTYFVNPNEAESDKRMVKTMVKIWTTFTSTGKPSFGNPEKKWPHIKEQLPQLMVLNIKSPESGEFIEGSGIGNIDFWTSLKLKENIPVNMNPTREEL